MNVTLIALVAGALIAGAAGGFFGARYFMQADEFVPEEAGYVKTEELPLPLEMLQNPLISSWQGAVSGNLTAKDEDSFTLEKDGTILTINIYPALTHFFGPLRPPIDGVPQPREELSINQIELGIFLRGNVQLSPQEGVYGHFFTIESVNE
jgi:hypothetical protein